MSKSLSFRPACSRDCQRLKRMERRRDRRMVKAGLGEWEGTCPCWLFDLVGV